MQQYAVPQFIDVKERIFGPLNFTQFIYVAIGGGLSYLFYNIFDFWIFLILSVPIMLISVILAFVKYNGQPASKLMLSGIRLLSRTRQRVWRREYHPERSGLATGKVKSATDAHPHKDFVSRSSLKKLAYILDTEGGIPAEDIDNQKKIAEDKSLMNPEDRQKKLHEILGR